MTIVFLSALANSGYRRAPATFAVGVRTALLFDSSRTETGHPRPVQITTWYPAKGTVGKRVTYGDYLDLGASEKSALTDSSINPGRAAFAEFMRKVGLEATAISDWMTTPMFATRDAEPAAGVFPLLILVQGNGQSAADESSLAEYMASHGYVVATAPSYTRISHPPADEKSIAQGAEEQADDISFVLETASRRTDVSSGKIGLVAHSLGARGALLFAMRNRRVAAMVSLDGGIGTATGRAAMEATPSFQSRTLKSAILHFYETADAFMAPDFTLLRELQNADVTLVRVPSMHHHHFADLGAWTGRVRGLAAATGATADTGNEYDRVLDLSRAFLDDHLKGGTASFSSALRRTAKSGRPGLQLLIEHLKGNALH